MRVADNSVNSNTIRSGKRVNRADLLRTLALLGEDCLLTAAEMKGFDPPQNRQIELKIPPVQPIGKGGDPIIKPPPPPIIKPPVPDQVHYYRVIERRGSELLPEPIQGVTPPKPEWYQEAKRLNPDKIKRSSKKPPEKEPLVAWAKLWPVLRSLLSEIKLTHQPDIPSLVKKVATGESLNRIPRKTRRCWAATVQVLIERPERTCLFNQDYNQLLARLKQFRGVIGLDIQTIRRSPGGRVSIEKGSTREIRDWHVPESGTTVFILSDLGLLDSSGAALRAWLQVGNRLQQAGCRPVVLLPLPERYLTSELIELFECVIWDTSSRLQPVTPVSWVARRDKKYDHSLYRIPNDVEQLLAFLSPAMRVEPPLLRAVRHRLPIEEVDVGHEVSAWHHEDVISSSIGFHFQPKTLKKYRRKFKELAEENPELARTITRLIRDYHCHVFPTQRDEELLILAELMGDKLEEREQREIEPARQAMHSLVRASIGQAMEIPALRPFLGHLLERQHDEVVNENTFYQAIWAIRQNDQGIIDETAIPSGWNTETVLEFLDMRPAEKRDYILFQEGQQELKLGTRERFEQGKDDFTVGSTLAEFTTRSGLLLKEHVNSSGKKENTILPLDVEETHSLPLGEGEVQSLHIAGEALQIERFTAPLWAGSIGRYHGALTAVSRKEGGAQKFYWNPPAGSKREAPEKETDEEVGLPETYRGFWYPELLSDPFKPEVPSWADACIRDEFGIRAGITINGVEQWFRWIEPASFLMGSPEDEKGRFDNETQHQVILPQGYWLAETACPQALWEAVMDTNPSGFKGENNPVENVSWEDVQEFLEKLNKQYPELKLRLPSEAEWENGCRAGTKGAFNFEGELSLEKVNYRGTWEYTTADEWEEGALQRTVEVTSFLPNSWGLYQMHGNVWEWCHDCYGEYPTKMVIDPEGPESGGGRVLRGGSWFYGGGVCRSAARYGNGPSVRYFSLGFRLARGHELQSVRSAGAGRQPHGSHASGARGGQAGDGMRGPKNVLDRIKGIFKK